jgi:uncharacterized protein (DUF2252 family)
VTRSGEVSDLGNEIEADETTMTASPTQVEPAVDLHRRAPAKVVPHLTPAERAARGKAARADVPRGSHGDWEPSPVRPDPIALLEEQAKSRVPELVPIRYGRMLTSPFAFYRGAAYLMAADLSHTPRSGLRVQLCGDAHLSNFGGFASPERRMVFSLNDFDETLPGPFEWDVKRLVASFAVAGRQLDLDDQVRRDLCLAVVRNYRDAMREFASMRTFDVWYARLDLETLIARFASQADPKTVARFEKNMAKWQTKDSTKALAKLTRIVDGQPRIIGEPPLITPLSDLAGAAERDTEDVHEALRAIMRSYRRSLPRDRRKLLERFRYVDAARKVVGVGSVGTRAWVVLLLGRDGDDPLFLQAKEAQSSVLEPFLGKSEFANHGQRVVEGQRMMQAASDIMLGWDRVMGLDGVERDFYVRQLWDWKASAEIELMDPTRLGIYAQMCAWTLARAHARSGDSIAIASYLGSGDRFDHALASFAEIYADQNERDFAALEAAVSSGRVTAQLGL